MNLNINGFVLLLLFVVFLISRVALQWKKKSDLWDVHIGVKHDENWVPNLQEILHEEKFMKYKRRVDYIFISCASFYEWTVRRFMQIKIFAKE